MAIFSPKVSLRELQATTKERCKVGLFRDIIAFCISRYTERSRCMWTHMGALYTSSNFVIQVIYSFKILKNPFQILYKLPKCIVLADDRTNTDAKIEIISIFLFWQIRSHLIILLLSWHNYTSSMKPSILHHNRTVLSNKNSSAPAWERLPEQRLHQGEGSCCSRENHPLKIWESWSQADRSQGSQGRRCHQSAEQMFLSAVLCSLAGPVAPLTAWVWGQEGSLIKVWSSQISRHLPRLEGGRGNGPTIHLWNMEWECGGALSDLWWDTRELEKGISHAELRGCFSAVAWNLQKGWISHPFLFSRSARQR